MRYPAQVLRRAASSFIARQALLSGVFAALVVVAMVAQAHVPFTRLQTSLQERAGLVRIRDAQALLTGIMRRQFAPNEHDDLAQRVDAVLNPQDQRTRVNPQYTDAVSRGWAAVQKRPADGAALADLAASTAELMTKLSDAANLSYDDDVDAINFGDAYTFQLPMSFERAANAAAIANRPAPSLTFGQRIAIGRLVGQSQVGWAMADNDYNLGVEATEMDIKTLAAARNASADRVRAVAEPTERHRRTSDRARRGDVAGRVSSVCRSRGRILAGARRRDRSADGSAHREESGTIAFTLLFGVLAIGLGLILIAKISRGMLERERAALQAEKDRAGALESELGAPESGTRERPQRSAVPHDFRRLAARHRDRRRVRQIPRTQPRSHRDARRIVRSVRRSFDADAYSRLLAGELPPALIERSFESENGSRWFDLTVFPVRIEGGDSIAAIAMIADVTDRKSLSEQLRYEAKHDALTGLLSRGAFLEDLSASLEGARFDRRLRQAVMLIDLDRFKLVNDTLGHAAGDDVLVTVAKRLRDIVRPTDILARLHGDEFALLVTTNGEPEVTRIAERAQHVLRAPFVVDGQPVCVDSSIGICIAQPGVNRPEELVRNADTAMYHAKRMGRGRHVYFNGAMHEASAKYMRLASEMLLGLERGEFRVAYQPIVALDDATIQGFEALLRWRHPELGEISPVEFIPIAEETGAIIQLGRFVLGEACRQVARWDWEHRKAQPVTMSINLSARQLEESIIADVEYSLIEAGISGDRLILEITESALLESGPQISDILARLRATGARMCLDDFGTGYSSLRYLQQFPIDQLKIDRSFVCGAEGGLASEPIVRMLLNLAESLGLRAVAEGIESEAQNDQLIALGCRLGQGFRFSPARPPSDIEFGGPLGPTAARLPALTQVPK